MVAGALLRQASCSSIDDNQKITGTGKAISRRTANFVGRLMLRRIARVCWHPGELRITIARVIAVADLSGSERGNKPCLGQRQ